MCCQSPIVCFMLLLCQFWRRTMYSYVPLVSAFSLNVAVHCHRRGPLCPLLLHFTSLHLHSFIHSFNCRLVVINSNNWVTLFFISISISHSFLFLFLSTHAPFFVVCMLLMDGFPMFVACKITTIIYLLEQGRAGQRWRRPRRTRWTSKQTN